jgi:hypothetical protein
MILDIIIAQASITIPVLLCIGILVIALIKYVWFD